MALWWWRYSTSSGSVLSCICSRKSDGRCSSLLLPAGIAEHVFSLCKGIPEEIANKAKYMVASAQVNPVGSLSGLYETWNLRKKYDILIIPDNPTAILFWQGIWRIFSHSGAERYWSEFFSLSKSFGIYRRQELGFLVGRQDVRSQRFRKLRSQVDFGCSCRFRKQLLQHFRGPLDGVKRQCPDNWERRDNSLPGLRDIRMGTSKWKGTMFVRAEDPGWPHRQHGILYGTDGRGRRHRLTPGA